MDRLQFPLDFKYRWDHCYMATIDMTDMWGPCRNGGVKPGFFEDKKAWRTWVEAARTVVMDWEGFDDWDWGGFTDVKKLVIRKLDVDDFRRLMEHILIFFIKTFVTRLSYYPSSMLCPLILDGPRCTKYRKKFATRLI